MEELTPIQKIQGLQPIAFVDKAQSVPYTGDKIGDIEAVEVNAFRDRINGLVLGLQYLLTVVQNSTGTGIDYSAEITSIQNSINAIRGGNTTDTINSLKTTQVQMQNLLSTGDLDLDTAQEWIGFMRSNKTLIESITTNKLNRSEFDALFVDATAAEKQLKESLIPFKYFDGVTIIGKGETPEDAVKVGSIVSSQISDFETAVQAQIATYMSNNTQP